jgi:hypothetical protein
VTEYCPDGRDEHNIFCPAVPAYHYLRKLESPVMQPISKTTSSFLIANILNIMLIFVIQKIIITT